MEIETMSKFTKPYRVHLLYDNGSGAYMTFGNYTAWTKPERAKKRAESILPNLRKDGIFDDVGVTEVSVQDSEGRTVKAWRINDSE